MEKIDEEWVRGCLVVKRDKYASAYLADNLALGESVNDRIDGKGSAGGSIDINGWLPKRSG